jgi:uncharacterized membrane protein
MATNIFETKEQKIGGAFTAENCTLDLGGVEKAIVQRVQFSIERPINMIYEISSSTDENANVYYVGGRRRGQATFERVVGGSGTFTAFVNNYGPLCKESVEDIVLTAKGGCNIAGGSKGITYTLKTPRITAISGSVSAQDIVITESVTMVFLDLGYEEK